MDLANDGWKEWRETEEAEWVVLVKGGGATTQKSILHNGHAVTIAFFFSPSVCRSVFRSVGLSVVATSLDIPIYKNQLARSITF